MTAPGANPAPRRPANGEARLVVTARTRKVTRLDDWAVTTPPPDPSPRELAARAAAVPPESSLWLAGGEPTLRADLPAVLAAVAAARPGALGMCTDGLALTEPAAIAPLKTAGLFGVRLWLHSPRPEAHDWLVDQPGAARQVLRAARACAEAGLEVELEATVTRPTMGHLVDLVELAARLEVAALYLRRLVARGPAGKARLMLTPRFALLERPLAAAAAAAQSANLRLTLQGFPPCTLTGVPRLAVPSHPVDWLWPEDAAWSPLHDQLTEPVTQTPCEGCPELPACGGAPAAYVAQFGARELGGLSAR